MPDKILSIALAAGEDDRQNLVRHDRTLSLRALTGQNPSMRVDLLTREYPPEVYGGAGVHVEYLARELRRLVDVRVQCMGAPRDEEGVTAYGVPEGLVDANAALRTLGTDLTMVAGGVGVPGVRVHEV